MEEELENGETRQVLKINPMLAPIKVNVFPLIKKRHSEKALENGIVTLRDRDTMKQINIFTNEILENIEKALNY